MFKGRIVYSIRSFFMDPFGWNSPLFVIYSELKNELIMKKETFKSKAIEVGDTFYIENPKPGYYNERKIIKIEGGIAHLSIVDSSLYGRVEVKRTDGGTMSVTEIQRVVDKKAKLAFDKIQKHNKDLQNLKKKLGFNKIKGGSLSNRSVANELLASLENLKKHSIEFKVASKSVGAGGFSGANSFTMRSSMSGEPITLSFNSVHRAGYYDFDKYYIVQVQVGGALDYELKKILIDYSKELLSKFTLESDLGKSYTTTTSGTNWSSAMLVAPNNGKSYTTLQF